MDKLMKIYKKLMEKHDEIVEVYGCLEEVEKKVDELFVDCEDKPIENLNKYEFEIVVDHLIKVIKSSKKVTCSKKGKSAYNHSLTLLKKFFKDFKKGDFAECAEVKLSLLQLLANLYNVVAEEMDYIAQEAKKLNEAIG